MKKFKHWRVSIDGYGVVEVYRKRKHAIKAARKLSKKKEWAGRGVLAFICFKDGKRS